MLARQMHQKSVTFATICWYFEGIDFKYEPYLCNESHHLMQKAMNFNDIAVASVKENYYRIHFWYMSKSNAIRIMNNSKLVDEKGVL